MNMDIVKIVTTVIGVVLGVILVMAVILPTVSTYVTQLETGGELAGIPNAAVYSTLLQVIVIVSIIGVLLVAVYGFMSKE
ncbi:MAG: hypothetical protein WC936_06465 [Candidatus Nanoarchaeia archaeon]